MFTAASDLGSTKQMHSFETDSEYESPEGRGKMWGTHFADTNYVSKLRCISELTAIALAL